MGSVYQYSRNEIGKNGVDGEIYLQVFTTTSAPLQFLSCINKCCCCSCCFFSFACEHWHNFFFDRKRFLRGDHVALRTLLSTSGFRHKPERLYTCSKLLHEYNFEVQYIPGSTNYVADMLSRLSVTKNDARDVFGADLSRILIPCHS